MQTVPLQHCEYDKQRKVLKLASEFFAGGFPSCFNVHSHHTGKDLKFIPINEHDPLFDQDQWDGEMAIYRPVTDVPNVDHLVIYHQW